MVSRNLQSQPDRRLGWTAVPRFQQCSAPPRDMVPTCNPLGAEMPKEGLGRVIYNLPASQDIPLRLIWTAGLLLLHAKCLFTWRRRTRRLCEPAAPDTLKISIVPGPTSRVKGRRAEGPISAVRAPGPLLSHSIRKHHHGLDWADQSHEKAATPL